MGSFAAAIPLRSRSQVGLEGRRRAASGLLQAYPLWQCRDNANRVAPTNSLGH